MKTLLISIGFSTFLMYDWESYVLDPKLTLTCNALHRKVLILYRIGKKYSASSASREKKRVKVEIICPFSESGPHYANMPM